MPDLCTEDQQNLPPRARSLALAQAAQELADRLFEDHSFPTHEAPLAALDHLRLANLLIAPLPRRFGGAGIGTEPGGQLVLLRTLAAIGGADLALGRIFEGHVNALILITAFGTEDQQKAAARDVRAGMLFGVWNTGEPKPMRLQPQASGWTLEGCKTFATAAGVVTRPIVTAEAQGWRMTMPRMEDPDVSSAVRIDATSWQPFGMESSQSLTIDFTGAHLLPGDLLGAAGDFYRDPLFRGGAIRFAAVQTGALVRLADTFADWLTSRGRQSDPYQISRLGEIQLLAQEAVLWIERAAEVAETCLHPAATPEETRRMIRCASMTRLGVQRAATTLLSHIVAGVGAHGLLRPARFERMVRDLTMYLRQPNADGTLADLGRSALLETAQNYWADSGVSTTS